MNREIVEAFSSLAREKRIEKEKIVEILEDVFSNLMRKKFGENAKFDVIINMERGEIEIYLEKQVVDYVTDPVTQISLSEARKIDPTLELGETYVERVNLGDFGIRLIAQAKQMFTQKLHEYEKKNIYEEYSQAIGEIIMGEVYQIRYDREGKPERVLILHNKNELILPKSEMIPGERFKKNETIRAIVKDVKVPGKNKGVFGTPQVIVSRADTMFLAKLFELEIPEVYDGVVEIKGIARRPGEKSKVAVASTDDRVDPVGACVGMKGVRIHAIVKELNNENIDVIAYSDDPAIYVARALQPAKPKAVEIDKEKKQAIVVVPEEDVSIAVGVGGVNVKLASDLTGYNIEIVASEDEKKEEIRIVRLSELKDRIGEDIYKRLMDAGIETTRDYLAHTDEGIKSILSGLPEVDEKKIKKLREIIRKASRTSHGKEKNISDSEGA